jgi:LacI family transcriptional regulator
MVTMRDVARHARVSTATVSRILNGQPGQASVETQRRVHEAVAALRYIPNSMARNLRRQDPRAWTLLLPTIENPFVTRLARGIEDAAQAAGFGVLMCNTYDEPGKERNYLYEAEKDRSSGVIITPTSPDVDISMLLELQVPVVSILRPLGPDTDHDAMPQVDTVLNDTFGTSRRATSHLIESGHRSIACLPGLEADYTDQQRLAGFHRAHGDNGLAQHDELVEFAATTVEEGTAAVTRLLDRVDPTAILIANSIMAIGVIAGLLKRGIDPANGPELFACDSAGWTQILAPYMSVAHQPAYEFGQTAARMLLDRLNDPTRPARRVILESTLDLRDNRTT